MFLGLDPKCDKCTTPILKSICFLPKLNLSLCSISPAQIPKDTERLEGVIAMIDTWSMAYSCLVCVVGATCVISISRVGPDY